MYHACLCQHVRRDSAALLSAQHRPGGAPPAAQQAEGMADADQRGVVVLGDRIEKAKQRSFPRRIVADSLTRLREAVVGAGIEMSRTARGEIKLEATARFRKEHAAAHVVRQHAHFHSRLHQRIAPSLSGLQDRVNYGIVTDIGPRVVHVQDGNVDAVGVRGRLGIVDAGVLEEIVRVMDVAHYAVPDASVMPCSVSEMMYSTTARRSFVSSNTFSCRSAPARFF